MAANKNKKFKIFSHSVPGDCYDDCLLEIENEINEWLAVNNGSINILLYQLDVHFTPSKRGIQEFICITVSIFYI